jgi:Protein kinase domain
MPTWSKEEIVNLGIAAFRREPLRCPRCKAMVKADFDGCLGRANEDVLLQCQRCLAHGEYNTEHLSVMNLQWSLSEKQRIAEHYWRTHSARCPQDRAVLDFQSTTVFGSSAGEFYARCPHCGRNFQSGDLVDPDTFGARYSIIRELGRGGMGQVNLVRRISDGKEFAAKRILPELLGTTEAIQRFQRESRICERLKHPHIVALHESSIDDHGAILIIDFMPGGTLRSRINDPALPFEHLVNLFGQVVDGLAFLHSEGVVHRDLKPVNVLIDSENNARISDFGLATLIDRDSPALTRSSTFLGTQHYAAPEQLDNARDVTAKADIYSLGIIAYEILTRCSPNRVIDLAAVPTIALSSLRGCLAPDPHLRPTSGNDLLAALRSKAGIVSQVSR